MKKLKTIGLVIGIGLSGLTFGQRYLEMIDSQDHTFNEIKKEAEKYFDEVGRGRGTGYKQFQRWEYSASRSLDDNGYVENANNSVKEKASFRNKYSSKTTTTTGSWATLGPDNLTITSSWSSWIGRLTSIAVDPSNYNHIIVTGPTGGVWKTTDGGNNWISLFDEMSSMDVYSSAIDPNNSDNYFVGVSGVGIMYSTDAGATWSNATGSGTSEINKIVIDPTNSNSMLLSKAYYGIYRSIDAGRSWSTVSSMTDDCYDIEFKPGSPSVVYASGAGTIHKSTNSGADWTLLSGPWSTSTSDILMMAVTPDNPDALWAVQEQGSSFHGLYKSTNSGTSFSTVNFSITGQTGDNILGYESDEAGGQAPRDMDIVISPSDENEIHVAGITTYRTTNGGSTFVRTTDWTHGNSYGFIHADCDAMYYVGNTIYFATDGGIFKSTDEASTFTDLTPGINTHQLYRIGISQNTDGLVTGGSQDNGACLRRASGDWIAWLGADGMETFIDKDDDDILIGTTQNGSLYKSTNGGQSRFGINPSGAPDGNWVTPFEQDPTLSNTYYAGFDQLYKTTNGGTSWTGITVTGSSGNMDELMIAPSNNQVIYAAYGSSLYKTTNGGSTWSNVSPSFGSSINYISIDPNNPDRVALALSSSTNRVAITTNGGSTWSNATDNLPSLTTYCVLLDGEFDNGIYVGMNGGIYYKNDNLSDFVEFSEALPNVRVYEMEIQETSKKIYAGTYGRGLWSSDVYAEPQFNYDIKISNLEGEWADDGALCANSIANVSVEITSKGQNTITAYTIKAYDAATLLETININTNLNFNETETIQLENIENVSGSVDFRVVVSINENDGDNTNDDVSMALTLTDGNRAQLDLSFDTYASETAWTLSTATGIITGDSNYLNNAEPVNYHFCLDDDCYEFAITDSYSDGLFDGTSSGSYEIVDNAGAPLVTMITEQFGARAVHSFCVPELTATFEANNLDILNCEQITFTANTTGAISDYDWDFGNDAIIVSGDGTAEVTVYYSSTGDKTVNLSVNGGIADDEKVDYVTVSQDGSIVPEIAISLMTGSNPACIGSTLEFSAIIENGGTNPSYDWYVNSVNQSINSSTFEYQPADGDAVSATITSNEECRTKDNATSNSIDIIVNPCTGVAESILGTAVNIHPNPTVDMVTITIDQHINGQTVKVYNNIGQVLFFDNNRSSGYSKKLDMSTFPIGTYFVHITSGENSIVRKIIKE